VYSGYAGAEYDGRAFLFVGDLSLERTESGGMSETSIDASLLGGYRLEPNLILLVGLDYFDSDTSNSRSSGSLGLEYQPGQASFGFYVESDDQHVDDTVLYGGYRLSEATEVSLTLDRQEGFGSSSTIYSVLVDYQRGPLEVSAGWLGEEGSDFNALGLFGRYDLGNRFRVFGVANRFDASGTGVTLVQVGGGYQLADDLWLDASYARADGGGLQNIDLFRLELTFETGKRNLLRNRIEDTREDAFALFSF
jgi:hypothetical protein